MDILYDAVFYDLMNCNVVKECQIRSSSDKIPITDWTAVVLKKVQ